MCECVCERCWGLLGFTMEVAKVKIHTCWKNEEDFIGLRVLGFREERARVTPRERE